MSKTGVRETVLE